MTLSGLMFVALAAAPAFADDKAACSDGIATARADLAKLAPEAAPAKAKKALKIAEREQSEAEFDKCLEALDELRRSLPK